MAEAQLKTGLNKQTKRNLLACVTEKLQGSGLSHSWIQVIEGQEETSISAFLFFGSILKQLSPSGDGDQLNISRGKGLPFSCGLINSPRARLSLARTWGHVPLSHLVKGPRVHELLIGQA